MSTFTFDGPLGLGADAVLKGTLFLALLFLASPALHRLSAGARHVVWGSGLRRRLGYRTPEKCSVR